MRAICFQLDLFKVKVNDPTMQEEVARGDRALRILLQALAAMNLDYLRLHPETPPLYASGVRYIREHGTENWETIPVIIKHGGADCEDLASWRVAELLNMGVQADHYLRARYEGGILKYHILVQLPDGTLEDPSRILGMGGPEDV